MGKQSPTCVCVDIQTDMYISIYIYMCTYNSHIYMYSVYIFKYKDAQQRSEYAAGPRPHEHSEERQLLRANDPVTNALKFQS